MSNKTTNVSLLGCVPFVIGMILVACVGFFGRSCQETVQGGIRSTINAVQGR